VSATTGSRSPPRRTATAGSPSGGTSVVEDESALVDGAVVGGAVVDVAVAVGGVVVDGGVVVGSADVVPEAGVAVDLLPGPVTGLLLVVVGVGGVVGSWPPVRVATRRPPTTASVTAATIAARPTAELSRRCLPPMSPP
jgi:hypothetical protein